MDIKQLKKELGLNNRDLAYFFDLRLESFQNTTAKKRYERALCRFYRHIKNSNT